MPPRLLAEEFIRLFLQHALPRGFQRIRYYGFLARFTRFGGGDPIPTLQVSGAAEPSKPFSVTMRKSYGFRTFRILELALYHSLGKLPRKAPQPELTHVFF